MYWMSRNVERAESLARIAEVGFNRAPGSAGAIDAFLSATFSHENRSSILSCIHIARQNAVGIRAELSTEVWEAINALYLFVESTSPHAVVREGPSSFLRHVRDAGVAFGGVVDATMTHAEEWNFLQLGRYLERGSTTVRVLQMHDESDDSVPEWQRLLEMCCASEPFARTLRHSNEPRDALAFLLLHRTFPRSLRYCAVEVDQALHRLSETQPGTFGNDAERAAGRLAAILDFVRLDEIEREGSTVFARRLSARLDDVGSAVESTYFPQSFDKLRASTSSG
jgi:uncharacterized alpha-E superfamily protein